MGKGDALAKFMNDKNKDDLTPLYYAENKVSIPFLKLLIDNGTNVDAVTNLSKSVMHMTTEIAMLLLLFQFLKIHHNCLNLFLTFVFLNYYT